MTASDRSKIRTFGRAFGPIEWEGDYIMLIFQSSSLGIKLARDQHDGSWESLGRDPISAWNLPLLVGTVVQTVPEFNP